MKKARKLGLQSLALVLMAFVLVAGVAFGMTGAWFTDGAGNMDNPLAVNFGKVDINTTGTDVAFYNGTHSASDTALTNPLMPGDHLDFKITVNNVEEEAYILVHMSVAFTNTANSANAGAFDRYYTYSSGAVKELVDTTTSGKVTEVGTLAKTNGTMTIDESIAFEGLTYGNDYQGATVTVSYEIRAIQAKNISASDATALLKGTAATALTWDNGASDGKTVVGSGS